MKLKINEVKIKIKIWWVEIFSCGKFFLISPVRKILTKGSPRIGLISTLGIQRSGKGQFRVLC